MLYIHVFNLPFVLDVPQARGVRVDYFTWHCYEPNLWFVSIFDFVVMVYIGLLQFFGIILAFLTRKVKISVLNESKSVSVIIYISSILYVVLFPVSYNSRKYINAYGAVTAGQAILMATFFLVLFFIPKVIYLIIIIM